MKLGDGRGLLLAAAALHLLFVVSLRTQTLNPLFAEAVHSQGQAGDFYGIYMAGDALLQGASIYDSQDYRNEANRRVPYFYFYRYLPPTACVAALGAWLLEPRPAYVAWIAANELLLLLLVVWILRLRAYPEGLRRRAAALWLGFTPFYLEQWMGQFSFLMAAFLWVVLRETLPDRSDPDRTPVPRQGAFWAWSAAIALKSFPALFAASYLARRTIRPVLAGAAVVVASSLPYFLARPADLRQFLFLNFTPFPPEILHGTLGGAALARWIGWQMPASLAQRKIVWGSHDVYVGNLPVFALIAVVVGVAAYLVLRHGRRIPMRFQLSVWVLGFFLIFKDVWEYHYVMLLPVLTALVLPGRSRTVWWIALLLALPTPYAILQVDGRLTTWGALAQHASKAIPAAALFVWTAMEALREGGGRRRRENGGVGPSAIRSTR